MKRLLPLALVLSLFVAGVWMWKRSSSRAAPALSSPALFSSSPPAAAARTVETFESSAVAPAPPSDWREELAALEAEPQSLDRDRDYQDLIAAWAARDPRAALAYVRGRHSGTELVIFAEKAVRTWARHKPEEALRWARSESPAYEDRLAEAILREVAGQTPALALGYAREEMALNAARGEEAYGWIMEELLARNQLSLAAEAAAQVESPDLRATLLSHVASESARRDPQQTRDWLMALPDDAARQRALANFAGAWAEKEGLAAAAFAYGLPPGKGRSDALVNSMGVWLGRDVVAASAWLDELEPHPDLDDVAATLATLPLLLDHNPAVGISWAASITDESKRVTALTTIVEAWGGRNRAGLERYLNDSNELESDVRFELLERLSKLGAER